MNNNYSTDEDTLMIEEIQFLHQEKRTALKIIRIGAAVFMAEMAAAGYALSAFRRHVFAQSVYSQDVLVVSGIIILVFTIGLMVGPIIRIRRLDREILKFKRRHNQPRVKVDPEVA